MTFPINLTNKKLASNTQHAFTIQERSKFGEHKDSFVIYMPEEAAYLVETNKAHIVKKKKALTKAKSLSSLLTTKTHEKNYIAYKYLRKKGYIPKTGLKFGADFRVYRSKEKHAEWLVTVKIFHEKLSLKELSALARTAHTAKKKALIVSIDEQEDVSFHELVWKKI